LTLQELQTAFNAACVHSGSRSAYIQASKQAMSSLRDLVLNGHVYMRYVVQIGSRHDGTPILTLRSQQAGLTGRLAGLGLAFFLPDGTLCAGGAYCNEMDRWNRYIGQARALRTAVEVPRDFAEDLHELPIPTYMRPNASLATQRKAEPPWDFICGKRRGCAHELPVTGTRCSTCRRRLWVPRFPYYSQPAVLHSIRNAIWFDNRESRVNDVVIAAVDQHVAKMAPAVPLQAALPLEHQPTRESVAASIAARPALPHDKATVQAAMDRIARGDAILGHQAPQHVIQEVTADPTLTTMVPAIPGAEATNS